MADRLLLRLHPLLESLNRRCSIVPNAAVFDPTAFPWVAAIERDWRTIRTELERVLLRRVDLPGFQEIVPDVGSITSDRGWKSFMLVGVGTPCRRNVELCPETWRIVGRIPGLSSAMFSIFEPGKELPPHRGPYNGVLRLHLGLIVPPAGADVGIRVGTRLCRWDEGRALVFDDSFEHAAWNRSGEIRVVLFVDFVRPLRFPANLINALFLRLAQRSPFVRDGHENELRWERSFYGG